MKTDLNSDKVIRANDDLFEKIYRDCQQYKFIPVKDHSVSYYIMAFKNGCTLFRQAGWYNDLEIMMDFPITFSFQDVVEIVQLNVDVGLFV